jgi:hypothetical protein
MLFGGKHAFPGVVKLIIVMFAFAWATFASMGFIKEMVPPDRKGLAVFPACLFFLFLSWFILL